MVVLTPLLTLIVPSWSPPHFGANFSCLKSKEKPPISFEISGFYGCGSRTRTCDLRVMRQSQGRIGVISAPICAFYRHSFGEFSIVSVQPCLLFSDSGSKLGQTRCTRTHSNSVSSSIAPEATARPTSTTSSFVQFSRILLTSRVELIYIERGSPGRKLFGLFSYIPKLR